MNEFIFLSDSQFGATSTLTTSTIVYPPASEILANMQKLTEEINGPPLIPVWVGPDDWIKKTDYPLIREDPYIDEDICYIVAGVGVIAGKEANKRLWEIGYMAVWSEEPPN